MPDSPRVLISYSHDSPDHEARVLALSDRLREDGIDAILDQYESFPPQGWIRWMNDQIEQARFVLVVCTETYSNRLAGHAEPGQGLGVTHEGALIQQYLYNTGGRNSKFIPVIFTAEDLAHIPPELQTYSRFQLYDAYEDLCLLLTGRSNGKKKPLAARKPKPDFRNSLWKVPARNPFFTGREPFLQNIHESFAQSDAVAISGIGGIGKTQTAIEYAHRFRDGYPSALWASAGENLSLLSGFAGLAQALELPEKDQKEQSAVARGVTRWLESHPGWLLILDNIDTIEDLNLAGNLVPPGGRLLITTRLQSCGRIARAVELTQMEPREGARFLLRRAGLSGPFPEAEQICREVDGLPLALDQAGAFIEETPSTLAEYLTLYQTEGARLRRLRGDVAAEHASVTVTFSLAFSRLAAKNPAAADLVRACAFLAPDAIPEDLFTPAGQDPGDGLRSLAGNALDFAQAIRDAGRFALLRRNPAARTLDIHRQVQEVLKDEMDSQIRRLWTERIVAVLAGVPWPEFRNWTRWKAILPHATAAARQVAESSLDSEPAARLLSATASYLDDRAQYSEAEPLYQRALAIFEKVLGSDDPQTVATVNNLAVLYVNQERFEQAEPLYRRALACRELTPGPDHPDTAGTVNNLALLYDKQGLHEQAEPLYVRALAIREKALGPDHPDTAASLNNLALHYDNQGLFEQAEPLYQRALAIYEKALGPDHPDTGTGLNNLAELYDDQGRHEQAEPLYHRALAICEKALGPDHPTTTTIHGRYAALLRKIGRDADAAAR